MIAVVSLVLISAFGCQNTNGQTDNKKVKQVTEAEKAVWKKKLTDNQYYIMVERGTERAFKNAYFNNHQKGVYVSAATGDVLFTSDDKYDSGTGWPSFVKPADPNKVDYIIDNSFGEQRIEVVEKRTGLHLGHVFDDGPADRGGKRYCMNSGALVFVKK